MDGRTVAEWALLYVAPESNPPRFPTTPGNRFLCLFLSSWTDHEMPIIARSATPARPRAIYRHVCFIGSTLPE